MGLDAEPLAFWSSMLSTALIVLLLIVLQKAGAKKKAIVLLRVPLCHKPNTGSLEPKL
jgi:hypothetical protein